MPEARRLRRDPFRRATADREDVDARALPVFRGLVADHERFPIGRDAVIVVDARRGEVNRELGELTRSGAEAIQPPLAVDQEVATVTGPVGGFETPVGAVDRFDFIGRDVDRFQNAAGGGVLRDEGDQEEHHPPSQNSSACRYSKFARASARSPPESLADSCSTYAGFCSSCGTAARKRLKSNMPLPRPVSCERSATASFRWKSQKRSGYFWRYCIGSPPPISMLPTSSWSRVTEGSRRLMKTSNGICPSIGFWRSEEHTSELQSRG